MKNENNKNKTPIFCISCRKSSGYFIEDFAHKKVHKPKYCKHCKSIVLDKPKFDDPIYN